jgi:two-component system phosphate regulon sensor histidine kinase PhoR
LVNAEPIGALVHVEVRDEGVGLAPEEAARCFDKFWQAESTDVRRFGGTGIGLYIVRSLVEAMGGRVDVSSELGKGTTFVIRLRTADEPDARPMPGTGESTSIREFMRQIGVPGEPR